VSTRPTLAIIRAGALILGFFAAIAVVSALSELFYNTVWLRPLVLPPALAFLLLPACVGLVVWSVWRTDAHVTPPAWSRVDPLLAAPLVFAAVIVVKQVITLALRTWPVPAQISQLGVTGLAVTAYGLTMALLVELIVRARDKRLGETLVWVRLVRTVGARNPIVWLLALLLASGLVVVYLVFPRLFTSPGYPPAVGFPLFGFAVVELVACTLVASYLVVQTARMGEAVAERLKAEQFKVELITNVSHDIRTPLTSIVNYVDLLKTLPVERDDFREYVSVLDRKSARLKTLIADLLEASKASTGNVSVTPSMLDLTEITGQITGEFDDLFAARRLTLVVRGADGPIPVVADSQHLWRVLENLFGNAAKYALTGTRVFADIGVQSGRATLSLKNTSEAPIDGAAEALMEQFIRGDRARQSEGSGLGLYIARSLLDLMDGELTIRATGDLFEAEVSLPLGPTTLAAARG
jgi:signal transduction histidine kinase